MRDPCQACKNIVHFRLDFITEANDCNWEQSDLGPYCLQYRLPKRGQTTEVFDWWEKG